MPTVILRDDDTSAVTPRDCLERLYRPFLSRGLPVNLAHELFVHLRATHPEYLVENFDVPQE